jgi:hypothetical protein
MSTYRNIISDFSSWGDFLAATRKLDPSRSTGSGAKWAANVDTVGAALRIADAGWAEGMDRVREISLPVVNSIAATIAPDGGWGWDVTGAAYDVGELLSGAPECWLTPSAIASRPCITISANIVSSGGIPARMLELRGAAVVALTLALQTAGYAVRVYAVEGMSASTTSGEDVNMWHRVTLTDDNGGPLDTDRLLFALAHPASPRQLGYALGQEMAGRSDNSWLGWPDGSDKTRPPEKSWEGDLYLAPPYYTDAEWENAESVSRWVTEQYERLTKGGD